MRSINILSAATVEATAQAHWVARAVSLTHPTIFTPGTTNFGLSWCINQNIIGHLYVSRFSRFRYSQERPPPRITRVTCISLSRRTLLHWDNYKLLFSSLPSFVYFFPWLSFKKMFIFPSCFSRAFTVCLSGELTRPWSRDVMLNADLKTYPLLKMSSLLDQSYLILWMCYQSPDWYTELYTSQKILKIQEWDETLES
jgi:hypothetical protein